MRRITSFIVLYLLLLAPQISVAHEMPGKDSIAQIATELLKNNYRTDGPGAAVLVVRGDQVLYRGAVGMADIEHKVPLKPDDLFRIGSLSKQFAAAGVLKLAEDGKLTLDDPLSKFVPDFPDGAHITVRQLLNHTAGVHNYTDIPGMMESTIRTDVTTTQLIDEFKHEKADFAPSTNWNYSNSGYVLIGAVIEAASGKPWYRYQHDALFEPLGMHDTGYGADPAIVAREVRGYGFDGDKIVAANPISMTQPGAAGALVSTLDDLQRWNRALHEGRVLKNASYTQMITPTGKAIDAHYGFGIEVGTIRGRPMLSHSGGIFGFVTWMGYAPGPDISVIVLQNIDGNLPDKLSQTAIGRMLMADALGDPYPAAVPVAVDTDTLKSMQGVYRIDAANTRILRVVDGQLTSERTGGQQAVLTPIAKDTFLFRGDFTRFEIVHKADGSIEGMRFFNDGEGSGEMVTRTDEPIPTARALVKLPHAALARLVGNYSHSGTMMKITLDGDVLNAQLGGQQAFALRAESSDRFYPAEIDATLVFSPASGIAEMLTLQQAGHSTEFKREHAP